MATTTPLPSAKRPLGATGLMVTPLCMGCADLGNMPDVYQYAVPEEQALDLIRAFFRDGLINFVDTAAAYGDGESERRIGAVLRELGGLPDGFVLATKADRDLATGDFGGAQIRRSVERSLRLLGLDRIQLCYLHDLEWTSFERGMAPDGPVQALLRCKEEGLIEHIGLASGPVDVEMAYLQTGLFEALISHNRWTLLNRLAGPLWDACAGLGVAAVNAAPYASGLLASGPAPDARYAYQDVPPPVLERARALQAICAAYGVPLAAAALQFSLRDPRIASTIVGVTRPERLAQTVELARTPILEGMWAELEAVPPIPQDPEAGRWA
jgi:D-threo-aldose 1-dehydrogenase